MIYGDFQDIVTAHGPFKAVIHVGAHLAQQKNDYEKAGVNRRVWIEANSDLCRRLRDEIFADSQDELIEAAVYEFDGEPLEFHITNHEGLSSSLLEFGTHKDLYPHIEFVDTVKVVTKSLYSILSELNNSDEFDFINLDLQGVELRCLRGLREKIHQFKAIYTEINDTDVYRNCDKLIDMDSYLDQKGFKRVWCEIYNNQGWGDALYIRK